MRNHFALGVPDGLDGDVPLPFVLTDSVESLLPPDMPVFPAPLVDVLVPAADPFDPPDEFEVPLAGPGA